MPDRRWQVIAECIQQIDDQLPVADRICFASEGFLDAAFVSIALVLDDAYQPVASSHPTANLLDEAQFSMGDGPTFDAQQALEPLLVGDLRGRAGVGRWPIFTRVAGSHGIASVFVFPLRIGAANLGAMTAYRVIPGPPTAEQFADGIVLATYAAAEIVKGLAGDANWILDVSWAASYDQSAVQFAAGIVAERLNTSIVDALVRIRAHAFATDMSVTEVARLIAEKRLELEH